MSIITVATGFSKRHLTVLKSLRAAAAALHGSAVARDDFSYEIAENILNAGLRYLKGDKEKLRENLRKRNPRLNLDKMVCL